MLEHINTIQVPSYGFHGKLSSQYAIFVHNFDVILIIGNDLEVFVNHDNNAFKDTSHTMHNCGEKYYSL